MRVPGVIAVVVVVVVAAVAAPVGAGPRGGKAGRIVRVERPRTGARGTPRICQFNPSDKSASCFGLPPQVGDAATIVTTDGVAGQVQVTKVEQQPGVSTSCTEGLWRSEVEITDSPFAGNPSGIPYGGWLIFDVSLTPGAKLVDPPPGPLPAGIAGETAAVTVDRDGEAPPEFMVTWYPCQGGRSTATGSSSTYCVDYWFGGASRWSKQRQDLVTWCM